MLYGPICSRQEEFRVDYINSFTYALKSNNALDKVHSPSGLSLGLQIAAFRTIWERDGEKRRGRLLLQRTRDDEILDYFMHMQLKTAGLTMFRMKFTHFSASGYNGKPSDLL